MPRTTPVRTHHFTPNTTLPPFPLNEVVLWWVRLDDFSPQALRPFLTPNEQERAARFYFERDRNHYIIGRGILRTLLGHYVNQSPATVPITYSHHHKPLLATKDFHFNIAHSNGLALMGFCRHAPIGVDVEYHRQDVEWREIMHLVYTATEQSWLLAHPNDKQFPLFYTLWARKEAFLKARGDGLIGNPAAVTLLPDEEGIIAPLPPEPPMRWTVQDVAAPRDFSAAVCTDCDG